MAKLGYYNAVLADDGTPIQATITVYLAGTQTKATIYTDAGGGTAKDNPFITDVLGRFTFFADPGSYDIEVGGIGITPYKIQSVQLSAITKSTELTDMPGSLSGQAGKGIRVKGDESGYEHCSGGGAIPVGAIIAYQGGYFTGSSNGGFTMVMASANTVAAVNTLLNPDGWYVCDGSELNHPSSPIWTGSGRYLPNLTDDRFLMGDTLAGGVGGSNTLDHTHGPGSYALAHTHGAGSLAHAHTHQVPVMTTGNASMTSYTSGGGGDIPPQNHTHQTPATTSGGASSEAVTGSTGAASTEAVTGTSGAASANENRPVYLSCFFIVRVF